MFLFIMSAIVTTIYELLRPLEWLVANATRVGYSASARRDQR